MKNNNTSLKHQIVPINNVNLYEWNEFLLRCSESTYFCSTDHWSRFDNSFILQARNTKCELVAGIPFRIETPVSVPVIGRFFRFCRSDSSVLVDHSKTEGDSNLYKTEIFTYLLNHIKDEGVVFYQISPFTRSHDSELYDEIGFSIDRCATFIIDLSKDKEVIFKNFSNGHRSAIRKAGKLGVEIKFYEEEAAMDYISEYLKLQSTLFEHKKESYSPLYIKTEKFLKSIFSTSFTKSYLGFAYYNGLTVAAVILVIFKDLAYGYLGATDYELIKESKASNLLEYEIMLFCKKKGYKFYDLGGIPFKSDSSVETHGVYKFKKSYGGDRYDYDMGSYIVKKRRYTLLWELQKYQNTKVFRLLYKLFRKG